MRSSRRKKLGGRADEGFTTVNLTRVTRRLLMKLQNLHRRSAEEILFALVSRELAKPDTTGLFTYFYIRDRATSENENSMESAGVSGKVRTLNSMESDAEGRS